MVAKADDAKRPSAEQQPRDRHGLLRLAVPESQNRGAGRSRLNGASSERYRTAVAEENIYLVCWFGGVAVAVVLDRMDP